jgi:hypothetical protein
MGARADDQLGSLSADLRTFKYSYRTKSSQTFSNAAVHVVKVFSTAYRFLLLDLTE